ncbi:MAG: hypothetical protein GY834_12625 [Bacteroidetes bacterium]|nr:hypothetical protein [Bacteroidota bacterium]
MISFKWFGSILVLLLVFLMLLTDCYADPAPLEVSADSKVNINSILHLTPRANPPANPSDGDKMDDGWEVTYNLDPLVNDADGDPDGDNLTNYMEYYFASDPTDYTSLPLQGTFYEYDKLGRITKIIRIK